MRLPNSVLRFPIWRILMTNKSYNQVYYQRIPTYTDPSGSLQLVYKKVYSISTGTNSPRIRGRLFFQQNAHTFSRQVYENYRPVYEFDSRVGPPVRASSTHDWATDLPFYSVSTSLDLSTLVNKWYDQAFGLTANLAEMFATRAKTVNTITSTAIRIATAYRHLRKGRWRACCDTLGIPRYRSLRKKTTDQWLEYVYGWAPLCQDVYTLCNKPFGEVRRLVKKHGRSRNSKLIDTTTGGRRSVGNLDVETRVTVRGLIRVTGSDLAAVSSFGVSNPALLAWELLPFSFVVDWFLPLGNYINAMCGAQFGFSISDSSVTRTTVQTYQMTATVSGLSPPFSSSSALYSGSLKDSTRTLGIPSYSYPKLKNPLTPTHFANAMSLLVGAFAHK